MLIRLPILRVLVMMRMYGKKYIILSAITYNGWISNLGKCSERKARKGIYMHNFATSASHTCALSINKQVKIPKVQLLDPLTVRFSDGDAS